MEKYILSIDQGTTSSRAIIFNKKKARLWMLHKKNLSSFFSKIGMGRA